MNRQQRHLGRELALLWLFQIDLGKTPLDTALATMPEAVEEIEGIEEEGIVFAQQLVRGVMEHKRQIDKGIIQYARGWSLSRMATVERNILRIAIFELLHMPDIPTSVSVDEAVEIAKRFGSDESGKFVNGILGAYIRGELQNPEVA